MPINDSGAPDKADCTLNPANGSYLNEFRMREDVGTSYTKYHDYIEENPYEVVHPPKDLVYVGWTDPGEWFNMTVHVKESGFYSESLRIPQENGGIITLEPGGKNIACLIGIDSTHNVLDLIGLAAVAPLELR